MIFPVVMYGCKSLTINKAERWRLDAFELWCWRTFLRVLWTARRSKESFNPRGNQSWIFIGRPDNEAETPILCPPDEKNWLTEKTLMLGKTEGRRRRRRQRMSWLDGITDLMDMSLSKPGSWWWTRKSGVLQSMGSQRVRHDWVTELQNVQTLHLII